MDKIVANFSQKSMKIIWVSKCILHPNVFSKCIDNLGVQMYCGCPNVFGCPNVLIAMAGWTDPDLRFWHYRDKDQVEVDLILSRGNKIWAAEIKSARTVGASDTKGLQRLAALEGNNFQGGIVLHDGDTVLPLCQGAFLAVPISKLWEI